MFVQCLGLWIASSFSINTSQNLEFFVPCFFSLSFLYINRTSKHHIRSEVKPERGKAPTKEKTGLRDNSMRPQRSTIIQQKSFNPWFMGIPGSFNFYDANKKHPWMAFRLHVTCVPTPRWTFATLSVYYIYRG